MKVAKSLALALFVPFVLFAPVALPAQSIDPVTAWRAFEQANGQNWTVEWNPATGTPKAIFGPGLKLGKGEISDLVAARRESTALLHRFRSLLGRGRSTFVEDIGVKANQVYIFVYEQEFRGLPVISGRADVRIHEIGTVAMFGAAAVSIPNGFDVSPKLTEARARAIGERHILGQTEPTASQGESLAAPPIKLVIWADTGSAQPTKATLAWEVQIDELPAKPLVGKVYVDANNGDILQFLNEVFAGRRGSRHASAGSSRHVERSNRAARLSRLPTPNPKRPKLALTGRVMAWTNLGILPTSPLTNTPMPRVQVTSSAGSAFTDAQGNFSIPYGGASPIQVTATLQGRHSLRVRVASGTQLTATASVTPGTAATIQLGTQNMGELGHSQTSTYWHVDDANVWLRGLLPGATGPMNTISRIDPRVNINSNCNAYYTRNTINFYTAGGSCNMTAFQTVIMHEWGHGLDAVFGGISQRDGLSEGWGDLLAIYRSRQPEVGPGFRTSSNRGIRTGLNTRTYPAGGAVHTQGQTWMGWAWDLRGYLMTSLGNTAGEARAHVIVVASIAADATDQPTAVREVFILDDDDGNLNNGTPNYDDLEKASLKRKLPFPRRVNPNAGSYTTYGTGCAGSGQLPSNCVNMNTTGTPRSFGTRANLTYAIRATAPANLQVTGFELYTSGGRTVVTRLYAANGVRPGRLLASSTMAAGSSTGWYRTRFATPININRGAQFYVAFVNTAVPIRASIRTGTNTPYYRNDGAGGSWNGPLGGFPWAYRVTCVGGPGAVPALSNAGVPELSRSFQLKLTGAKANGSGLLLIGISDKLWSGRTLPLDLASFGAPGCRLLASLDAVVAISTNAQGAATQTFTLPSTPGLFKAEFFNQYAVSDPTNGFGIVFSNGGHGKIGKR